jgi:anhydro-N-acetylmuramic acid kinase
MNNRNEYHVIGLMSGTSLDGVDIAFCTFSNNANGIWNYEIRFAETVAYPLEWKNMLSSIENATALIFQQIHLEYGFYLGNLVKQFVEKHQIKADFIASHGHTIFHADFKPHLLRIKNRTDFSKKITVQIGSGSAIAAECNLPVVCDFRTTDVALGGQGAPLVPIGDKLLFPEYEFCLNLGGFANISYQHNEDRIAYDICPVNIVMNALCAKLGKSYDDGGGLASSGKLNELLLNELNALVFYHLPLHKPKSLGKEWVIENINPLLEKYNLSVEDALNTMVEHIAMQIAKVIQSTAPGKLFITGGGAFNTYLIERIQKYITHKVVIPPQKTIEFKEALIFAFLGVLRMRNEINCLKSVTGAGKDNVGGAVYMQ